MQDQLPPGSLQDDVRPYQNLVRPHCDELHAGSLLPGLYDDSGHLRRVESDHYLRKSVPLKLLLTPQLRHRREQSVMWHQTLLAASVVVVVVT